MVILEAPAAGRLCEIMDRSPLASSYSCRHLSSSPAMARHHMKSIPQQGILGPKTPTRPQTSSFQSSTFPALSVGASPGDVPKCPCALHQRFHVVGLQQHGLHQLAEVFPWLQGSLREGSKGEYLRHLGEIRGVGGILGNIGESQVTKLPPFRPPSPT